MSLSETEAKTVDDLETVRLFFPFFPPQREKEPIKICSTFQLSVSLIRPKITTVTTLSCCRLTEEDDRFYLLLLFFCFTSTPKKEMIMRDEKKNFALVLSRVDVVVLLYHFFACFSFLLNDDCGAQ